MLQIGLVGAGRMGSVHAAALARTDNAVLRAVYDPDGEKARALAERYGAAALSAPEKLFDQELDALVIATPTYTHAEYLKEAHRAQLHVLCEKPLVRTADELREIEAMFAHYPKVVMVGHTVRFFPEYEYARDVLRAGELGELGVLRLSRCAGLDAPADSWLFDFEKSGAVVLDLMIHDLDFVEWAVGPFESLFAFKPRGSAAAQDMCLVIGRLSNGAIVHLEASWAEPPHTFYYAYEIAASQGILDYDSRRSPAYSWEPHGVSPCHDARALAFTPTMRTPYERQAEAFVNAVTNGNVAPINLNDGARAVRLALAVLHSVASGEPADVTSPE
jgi:predicted dehydrogenase